MMLKNLNLTSGYVLVAGDVILDRYWSGSTGRISPEAPVPVVRVDQCQERPGGAGNVALNVKSLGTPVRLVGVTGADDAADALTSALRSNSVECSFIRVKGSPTVAKLRVISQHQQLLRLDFEAGFPHLDIELILQTYSDLLNDARVVVLSDYAKGSLVAVGKMIAAARLRGLPVIVDPKGSDCAKYRGASVVTPNLREFEALVGKVQDETDLEEKARALAKAHAWDALLITRGEQGMTLVERDGKLAHFAAQAKEVFDVTGAGDTVVAVLASALAHGLDLEQATSLANSAAGIVVGKLGAATLNPTEVQAILTGVQGSIGAICTEPELIERVAIARAGGERIVMTNGCFDILHAGHVDYLERARRLGDRLIVAVNDDESVSKLKGTSRPVNALVQRMAVLSGLRSVDWVVPFSQPTPRELICKICPDVLVKGGDYRPYEIAGADCVKAGGGEVVTIELVPDCSTTKIIAACRRTAQGEALP